MGHLRSFLPNSIFYSHYRNLWSSESITRHANKHKMQVNFSCGYLVALHRLHFSELSHSIWYYSNVHCSVDLLVIKYTMNRCYYAVICHAIIGNLLFEAPRGWRSQRSYLCSLLILAKRSVEGISPSPAANCGSKGTCFHSLPPYFSACPRLAKSSIVNSFKNLPPHKSIRQYRTPPQCCTRSTAQNREKMLNHSQTEYYALLFLQHNNEWNNYTLQ